MTAFGLGLFAFLLLVGGAIWWRVRQARKRGEADQRARDAEQDVADAREARRIESEVDGLTDAEVDEQLGLDARDRGKRG